MKKWLSLVLVFLMALCPAVAEETVSVGSYELAAGTTMQMDLDGDGSAENVEWRVLPVDEYEEAVNVRINGKNVWTADCLMSAHVYAADIDGDGKTELLVSGDEMSDDYVTFCLRWENGAVRLLPFADICRGENGTDLLDYGYGKVVLIGENVLVLSGSQDVLGTYFGSRTLSLCDEWFMVADDGLWRFDRDLTDPEIWEYSALALVQDVPAMFIVDTEMQKGTLKTGEKMIVTASDKQNVVWFATQDGREGFLTIEPDEERGWGHCIDGRPEAELFEYVPYAD